MTDTVIPSALPLRSRRSVESRDPATGQVWQRYDSADATTIANLMWAARRAQPIWAAQPIRERVQVLRRFRELLFDRRQDVAFLITRENGKPTVEALASEVLIVLDYAQSYAKVAPRLLRRQNRWPTTLSMLAKSIRVEYVPHGVVGVISPWNYPFMLAAGIMLPALVAGNAVILKPSEFTPSSGQLLVELLRSAGVPADIVACVPGDGITGAALVNSGVDKVSFTGSVATGRKVARACAEQLIPCSLELGGSDPAIVLKNADVARAARGIAWGRFSNAGQTCVAPKRVYVVDSIYDEFAQALATEVNALVVGAGSDAGVDVGPLVRPIQATQVRAQFDDAIALGARVLARAAAPEGEQWVAPTVLDNVPATARMLTEETFGPVLPLVRVKDADEAVRLANESEFGLSASVWGRGIVRTTAIARRLHAGTVAINDVAVVAGMADVPHGGTKSSGMGRAHGAEGLLEFVRTRTIVSDRVAFARQPWWFRYGAGQYERFDAVVRAMHGRGWNRVTSMIAAAKSFL